MHKYLSVCVVIYCCFAGGLACRTDAQLQPSQPFTMPPGLEVCEGGCVGKADGNFGTWIFHGTKGDARWTKGQNAKLIIERFDQGGVRIRREDLNGFTAVYEGSLRGSRIEGTVTATAAFFRKPGNPTGTVHYSWYATVPSTRCNADSSNSAQDWFETGGNAVKFRQMPDAFQCFLQAAQAGNGPSKGLVGLMYRDGIGTNENYAEALRWLKAGAVQGDYNAQLALSQMYEAGTGTQHDANLAQL